MRRPLLIFCIFISSLACLNAASVAADKNQARKRRPANIDIATFDIKKDVEVPPDFMVRLDKELPRQLAGTNKFKRVLTHGEAPANLDGPELQMTGTLTEFSSGNRAERYLLGHGAGAGAVVAHVRLSDLATGHTLLDREISTRMSSGAFGGSSRGLAVQLAKKIAHAIKKEPLQEREAER